MREKSCAAFISGWDLTRPLWTGHCVKYQRVSGSVSGARVCVIDEVRCLRTCSPPWPSRLLFQNPLHCESNRMPADRLVDDQYLCFQDRNS